jgi:hypothetical protein
VRGQEWGADEADGWPAENGHRRGAKGLKGRQRPLVTPTHTAAQTATSSPPPERTVAPIAGHVAIIPKPKATVHSAGPTPTQHPLQGTWLSVTLTARGSCVVAVLVKCDDCAKLSLAGTLDS